MCLAALAAWWTLRPSRTPPPNVILISIDTLRPDYLGCGGSARPTSPTVDQLCREGVWFASALSHAPSTLISHGSILTSLIPQHHDATAGGASFKGERALSPETLTLAEVLKARGYRTHAVTAGGQLAQAFGLDQGFDSYEERTDFASGVTRSLELVDAEPGAPFFLFLHTYDVHHPYRPTPDALAAIEPDYRGDLPPTVTLELVQSFNSRARPLRDGDLDHILNVYAAGVLTMDRQLGRLIEELKRRRLYDDTLIVFLSDHGEEFGEHGVISMHGHDLWDEMLRIPLLFKLPGGAHAGAVVRDPVRGIDVAPSILAALQIPAPPAFEGRNVLPGAPAASGDLFLVLRREAHPDDPTRGAGVRTSEWKLNGARLFDLRSDPGEKVDLAAKRPAIVRALFDALQRALSSRPSPGAVPFSPSDELRERLRSLGYAGR